MKKLLKTDSFLLGIVYAIVLPFLLFGIIYLFRDVDFITKLSLNPKVPYLVSLIPNLIVLRFLFVPFKLDKTGRGMLAITFAWFLVVFIFIR
jgi:hypothetical protein